MIEQQAAPRRRGTTGWSVAVLLSLASAASAVPIYGGPAVSSAEAVGDQTAILPRIETPTPNRANLNLSVGNGVGLASTARIDRYEILFGTPTVPIYADTRPVRWSAVGISSLDTLGGDGEAGAVNASGLAVGFATKLDSNGASLGNRALRWDVGGTAATELGTLGTSAAGVGQSRALLINDAGTIGGVATKYVGGIAVGERAVRWTPGATAPTELALPAGTSDPSSVVLAAMNSGGAIAGQAGTLRIDNPQGTTFLSNQRAVRWNADGTLTPLADVNDLSNAVSYARAINDGGVVVGSLQENLRTRAARWAGDGTLTVLGGLDGANPLGRVALARAVDANGAAYGASLKTSGGKSFGLRPVRWTPPPGLFEVGSTAAIEMGMLGVDADGVANGTVIDANAAGVSVGNVDEYDAVGTFLGQRGVFWTPDGRVTKLDALIDPASGWLGISGAVSVNDANWVTAFGLFDADGAGGQAAYERMLVIQVPEPTALVALAGVAPIALRRRRVV